MIVFAADPGLTTGWAVWRPDWGPKIGETEGFNEFMDAAYGWASKVGDQPATIVAERFVITPETGKKTQAPWSLEVSGGLRFLCHRYGLEYVQQAPADAKGLVHDDRLRALGWWTPTPGGHANDAARHLAYLLARRSLLRLPATNRGS